MAEKSQTIGLVMIVKDESANMVRLIQSVKALLSTWTILDTGSSDDTVQVVRELLGDLQGDVLQTQFVNFGQARSQAIAVARGTADYLLMLDADMQVEILDSLPDLHSDAYLLTMRDGSEFEYRLPLLLRDGKPWRYEGVTHEYLTCDEPFSKENLDAIRVIHNCDGSRRPEKFTSDLELLTTEFARNPTDARTVFYLAQTHRDLGNFPEAICLYQLRADMGGWDEEVYYARYQLGCLLASHVSFARGADELLRAWRERPTRIEALRALANSANAVADKAEVPDDVLFVHRDLYTNATRL